MMDEELERLAWQRIDGEISPSDRARLEELEARHPELRADIERLSALSDVFARIKEVPPPSELRPRIDRAVAASSPRWRRSASVVNMWRPRLAYLAAGLLVGAVVARLLLPVSERQIDVEQLTGAMRPAASLAAGGVRVDLTGGRGTLSHWREGTRLMTALDLSGEQAVELVIEAESGALDFLSVRHSGGSASELVAQGSRFVLHAAGPGHHVLAVIPAGEDTAVRVAFYSGGTLLAGQTVVSRELGQGK